MATTRSIPAAIKAQLHAATVDAVRKRVNTAMLPMTIWRNVDERCWEFGESLGVKVPDALCRVTVLPDCWWRA